MNKEVEIDASNADSAYHEVLLKFELAVTNATRVSTGAAGRQTEPKRWWASVLFTRLCTSAVSILVLSPINSLCKMPFEHWDFSSIAMLARAFAESYFMFFYLCVEAVEEDEWRTRLNLIHLHDCTSRIELFQAFGMLDDEKLKGFAQQQEELRKRLLGYHHFSSLTERRQIHLLKGRNALLLTRDEILARMGDDFQEFRGLWRLFCAHVHSAPLAFHRMSDGRGRGVENLCDKGYTTLALRMSEMLLGRAIGEMISMFPDLAEA
ncbi:MAG: DUF5677 domain-containing protein [Candidatus Binataceae bacterium]